MFAITTFDYNYRDSIRFPFYNVRLHIIALFVSLTSIFKGRGGNVVSRSRLLWAKPYPGYQRYKDLKETGNRARKVSGSLGSKAAEERETDLNTACDDPLSIYLYDFRKKKTTTKKKKLTT